MNNAHSKVVVNWGKHLEIVHEIMKKIVFSNGQSLDPIFILNFI